MKKNMKFSFIAFFIFSFIFIFPTNSYALAEEVSNKSFTQIIAFGDSYSDNGEAKRITSEIMEVANHPKEAYLKPSSTLYWENRYSNGLTAVEVLAKKMNIPLTNYAVGGATSGEQNYSSWMDFLGNTGTLGQIKKFGTSLKATPADPNALYFIFTSANDYCAFMDYAMPGTVEAVADEAVDNIKMAVRMLSKLGAKNFFIVNSSDLSLLPYEISNGTTASAKVFTQSVNAKLPKSLDELQKVSDISIILFDLPAVSDSIVSNPKQYGLVELTKPCQPTYPEVKPAHKNSEQYYFWDEWHCSEAAHKIIGEKMYEEVLKFKF